MEQTATYIVTCLAISGGDIVIEIVVGEELEQEHGVVPEQNQLQHRWHEKLI